jgi:hypothetical protein
MCWKLEGLEIRVLSLEPVMVLSNQYTGMREGGIYIYRPFFGLLTCFVGTTTFWTR